MNQNAEFLKKTLHLDLLRDVARLVEGRMPPAEVEPLLIQLAVAIQEFPYAPLKKAFVEAVRVVPLLRPTPETVQGLAPLAKIYDQDVAEELAHLFSNVAPENAQSRQLCEELLELYNPLIEGHRVIVENHRVICVYAALGLARCGDLRQQVWTRLALRKLEGGYWKTYFEPAVREFLRNAPASAVELMFRWLTGEETDWENGENMHLPDLGAHFLKEMGKEDQLLEFLVPKLNSEEDYWRQMATDVLLEMHIAEREAVEALMQLVNGEHKFKSYFAAQELHAAGKADERVVAKLFSWLKGEDREMLWRATDLLIRMGRKDPEIVDALRRMLDTRLHRDNRLHQDHVVYSLINMGEVDEPVIEAILSIVTEWSSRTLGINFLEDLEDVDDRIVQALLPYLTDEDKAFHAARLLLKFGKAEEEVVAVLLGLLEDEIPHLAAAYLLQETGKATENLEAKLRSWLNNQDDYTRFEAVLLLEKMGKADEQVIKAVLNLAGADVEENFPLLQKVLSDQPLSSIEWFALSKLLKVAENGDYYPEAREWLYNWLWSALEAKEA